MAGPWRARGLNTVKLDSPACWGPAPMLVGQMHKCLCEPGWELLSVRAGVLARLVRACRADGAQGLHCSAELDVMGLRRHERVGDGDSAS